MVRPRRLGGFSLVELLVVTAIVAVLVLVAMPFTRGWNDEASVAEGKSMFKRAVGKAQAVALRNPLGHDQSYPAAGVRLIRGVLIVCEGHPVSAGCSDGGSAMLWREALPSGVSIQVNDAAWTHLAVNNRGRLINNSGAVQVIRYSVNRGSVNDNDAANELY